MQIDALEASIKSVISQHYEALQDIAGSQTKLLELASATGIVQHFRTIGYLIEVKNPKGNAFRVKTSTRGRPLNFSFFVVSSNKYSLEVHINLPVRSARDEGIYCVDVAVILPGSIGSNPDWKCVENTSLITFAEAKKLTVYPMLLAHFIDIVHEIKPSFLSADPLNFQDMPQLLITLGNFSGNSLAVVRNYPNRLISVLVAENYDIRLAKVRAGGGSPFPELGLKSKPQVDVPF